MIRTDNPPPDLPNALRAKRRADGLSVRDAARLSGVSFSTIARIERGHPASARSEAALRDWLDAGRRDAPDPLAERVSALERQVGELLTLLLAMV